MTRRRHAPPPPPDIEEIRRKNREADRKSAAPASRPQRDEACCGKHLYRVVSHRVVHSKRKGEVVELCDNGATQALVQVGHLVPVQEASDKPGPIKREPAIVKAEPEKEANDG